MITRRSLISILCSLGLTYQIGLAAQAGTLSEPDRQTILTYPLTLAKANELIAAMTEMTRYLMSRPDIAEVMARSAKMTLAERAAQMERDPKAMAIASQHGLKATDYTFGVPALRMALLAAQGASGPTIVASPANVAFAKANLTALKPKMDAADGRR